MLSLNYKRNTEKIYSPLELAWKELVDYYQRYDETQDDWCLLYDKTVDDAIRERMDAEADAHPEWTTIEVKSRMHEVISEMAEPVIFRSTPFSFECKLRNANSWGCWGVATWTRQRFHQRFNRTNVWDRYKPITEADLSGFYNSVDYDHYNIGYNVVLKKGYLGLIADAESSMAMHPDEASQDFLKGVVRSLKAVLHLVERFVNDTEAAAAVETDPVVEARLRKAAEAMRQVPANPPRNFYEALMSMCSTRELFASFEGVGVSILGNLDRHLSRFYEADIANGTLTEKEAEEILAQYLVLTDIRHDVHHNPWAETSTTMNLGGCDEEGNPLYTPLTKLILKVHDDLKLINPKPQCRISSKSDESYIRQLAEIIANGRNVLTIFNDDVLIPAQVKMGKRVEDARLYVNGGCQEHALEGVEHSEGAHWYFPLVPSLQLTLHPDRLAKHPSIGFVPVTDPKSFEDVYNGFKRNVKWVLDTVSALEYEQGSIWPEVNPCPLISAAMADCIERGKDFTQGGGRYGPMAICFWGLATIADSLNVIRMAVFEKKLCTYDEFMTAIRANWVGYEDLHAAVMKLPHYGQDTGVADEFVAKVAHDIAMACNGMTTVRGGPYQPAFFSYWGFSSGDAMATPDGREAGNYVSQGASPSRIARVPSVAHYISSISKIDWTDYPSVAVLDMQLPLSPNSDSLVDAYVALLKTFVKQGGGMVQCSVVNPETLKHAQVHPEQHADLVVRVAGYSAYFTALNKNVQDEIITRHLIGMG
jgi:pyruvate-formate lyase